MMREYKLNNPMNIAVIRTTFRVIFVIWSSGGNNYGERAGREPSGGKAPGQGAKPPDADDIFALEGHIKQ